MLAITGEYWVMLIISCCACFVLGLGMASETPNDHRTATARYYCGSNGGLATVNERGDEFICKDGSTFNVHIEHLNDGFQVLRK